MLPERKVWYCVRTTSCRSAATKRSSAALAPSITIRDEHDHRAHHEKSTSGCTWIVWKAFASLSDWYDTVPITTPFG